MEKSLIIAEKPSAAAKIADAIAEGSPVERELHGVKYYELERDGREVMVVPALGHLFTLKNPEPIRSYPTYDVEWVPSHTVDKSASRSKHFVDAIEELAKGADEFVNATDFDIEGAVIGYNVLRYLCRDDAPKMAKRMKFSTMISSDLREAYENLLPSLDFGLVNSGIARHLLDWYWGMNLSKALTSSVEAAHDRFVKLPAGRVQTPTLKLLLDREVEIDDFDPEPYWTVELLFELNGQEVKAKHKKKKFWNEDEAEGVREVCKGKPAKVVKIKTRKYQKSPPTPFNLSSLQSEAYKCFGFTPARTQRLAQGLYDAALISYPRTSSKKLPPSINYRGIIEKLSEIRGYKGRAKRLLKKSELKPRQGKKEDPAHPAIYPTGEKPEDLRGGEKKVYDLIAKRFLAAFGEKAVKQSLRVDLDIEGQPFFLRGRRILERGWLSYYEPYGVTDEIILPELKKGQELEPEKILYEEKETNPPARYNQSSIVKEMESRNLGTKSTRATIVQGLYDANYVQKNPIEVTEIGRKIVESLTEYCPDIVSEDLTIRFEKKIKSIQEGDTTEEEILEEAKENLNNILEDFRKHEAKIGKSLGEAYRQTRRSQKILGDCPECGSPMKIVVSRKTKKRFAGCTSYPDCQKSFPLPQNGSIIPLDKTCSECGLPTIKVIRRKKRPYTMCLDPDCPTKDDWK